MATIERELKLLLQHDSYKKIINSVEQNPTPIRQTNYYFDSRDFKLEKSGVTLRIRNEDTQWLLCAKIKSNSDNSFISSKEIETSITELEFEYLKGNPSEIFKRINKDEVDLCNIVDSSELFLLGSIENERLKLKLFSDYILELDHSIFPGGNESYELEVEGVSSEKECSNIMNQLQKMGIDFYLNNKSKYKRFVEYITTV
ncbi:CYTH domain-containing protein [Paenibacillus sp. chi10]|uniref:CYTH domain-containing protein n=1 Tax=Paenibacillus suaedae TaxID=3077233 RepID=A0AAJ2K2Q9_9BACL|nr:CYTH domain-containing protein [Paenibacillus sp. chi10]MDT8978713.1 CYTH domain-containing protein [Paenibacillus sp. chi10]